MYLFFFLVVSFGSVLFVWWCVCLICTRRAALDLPTTRPPFPSRFRIFSPSYSLQEYKPSILFFFSRCKTLVSSFTSVSLLDDVKSFSVFYFFSLRLNPTALRYTQRSHSVCKPFTTSTLFAPLRHVATNYALLRSSSRIHHSIIP